MPLGPTTYLLLVRPTPGGDDDAWDDELNTALGLIDGHRHIPGEGRQVTSAGLNIDADLSFGNHRITSAAGLALQNLGAALTSGANEFFAFGGNAYFRNNGGTNVQLTSGATLNMTTVGGIAGDYTAVGAQLAFTDATDTYTLLQQLGAGVRQFAKVGCGDLSLYEYKANPAGGVPASAVTLKSPAALAAPYALTMPAALPGSTQLLQVSSGGLVLANNNVVNAVTLASLLTANAGITLAANQHVTVSGVGEYKHGDLTLILGATSGDADTTASAAGTTWGLTPSVGVLANAWYGVLGQGANDIVSWSIPLKAGDRIKSVRATVRDTAAGNTVSMQLRQSTSLGANAQVGATQTSNGAGVDQTLALTGLTSTLASGNYFTVTVANDTAVITTNRIYGVEVTYDRP